ncbi:hypothetical protein FH972_023551 [Carpinus fangiana]|uniref:Protein PBN1 n=1 Tax=Carpinus fangiana TaxID=176857 RepID=A0A5N6KVH6_9ROSI|nr:hypothetical protein FH972_023551 [Carpinus fangiana]
MPLLETIKMEDRKRPALDQNEHNAPPFKRASTVNGVGNHGDSDLPGNPNIEVSTRPFAAAREIFADSYQEVQKDAALRQMKEYKRQCQDLESQLSNIVQKSAYHDEHLRLIDAWFNQLIDEVALLAGTSTSPHTQFNSALLNTDTPTFEKHLFDRSSSIKSMLTTLFSAIPAATAEVSALQDRLASLLAQEKTQVAELQKITSERDEISERHFTATQRYMIAEKKLDRTKSATVQKLEAQAIASSKPVVNGTQSADQAIKREGSTETNGAPVDSEAVEAAETARKEAVAVSAKRAEQIEKLVDENKKLNEKLSAAQIKATTLSDQDYAHCELFKTLKTQNEDVIKRVNDLEATNVQLREEAKQLHAERTLYREENDNELRNHTIQMETEAAETEANLARIRHARDELNSEVAKLKAEQEQAKVSAEQSKQLVEAREARIAALESEAERLRSSADEASADPSGLSKDELEAKLRAVEKDKSMLEGELRSMEQAWKKAQAAASKKWSDTLDAEEKLARLAAEKSKADQKYFGAMKAKETREAEIRMLRQQNSKSSEIVSQLKDAESSCRGLLVNLEKQLAEARDNLSLVSNQQRASQYQISEHKSASERLTAQMAEVQKALSSKDTNVQSALQAQRLAEEQLASLKIKLGESEKQVETWRKRGQANSSEDAKNLRMLVFCSVCRREIKNVMIGTCQHTFCKGCVDNQIKNRDRRCPNCNKGFGDKDDVRLLDCGISAQAHQRLTMAGDGNTHKGCSTREACWKATGQGYRDLNDLPTMSAYDIYVYYMKHRITYIRENEAPFEPSQLTVQANVLDVKALHAAKEHRLTIGLSELPAEVRGQRCLFTSRETNWNYSLFMCWNNVMSFAYAGPPQTPQSRYDPFLLGGIDAAHTQQDTFSTPPILSERFTSSTSAQYYQIVPSLAYLTQYIQSQICWPRDTACQEGALSLLTAKYFDADYDAISHALIVTAYWSAAPDSTGWAELLSQRTPSERIEVGVLNAEPPTEPEELSMAGFLAVLGTDTNLKPTLFSFPARHHPLPPAASFSMAFDRPTGLHPTLRLSVAASAPPHPSCALHAYLALPSHLFLDRHQFSDPLFLAQHRLAALRALSGATDLEAPDWATPQWGSAALFELAPPGEGHAFEATLPMHLRYLPPAAGGWANASLAWPAVFWACRAEEGTKMAVNPFDRVGLGFDGLFGERTMFYHLGPEGGAGGLVETVGVPVLDMKRAGWIEAGTVGVVVVGFAWLVWKLLRPVGVGAKGAQVGKSKKTT